MSLTNTAIRNAKSGDKAKRMYDERGLYLEISPRGGKWWRLKYRYGDKEKRISLGVYPDVSLKDARERRDEARKLLANDIDPSEQRKANKTGVRTKTENSFEVVTREWFAKYSANWSESHAVRVLSLLERDILPCLGNRPIADITPSQLLEAVQRIEYRGALESAHRALQNCGQVFRMQWPQDVLTVILRAIYVVHYPPIKENTSHP